MYKCICGKQFNTANQLNGHKSSWFENNKESVLNYLNKEI